MNRRQPLHASRTTSKSKARSTARQHVPEYLPTPAPVLSDDLQDGSTPDRPFAEGTEEALGPDLRHRLITAAAFHHLEERGFAEGNEVEDWTRAEDEVDHMLLNPFEPRSEAGRFRPLR